MSTLAKINNPDVKRIKVLITPLDWGLGHATRCIPIIKELINQQCEVSIAATGVQRMLLEGEFPTLRIVELPGYNIKFGKNRASTILRILLSIPKILIRIKQERVWLQRYIALEQPDWIISDNRYGMRDPRVFSVFITHQLFIKTPFGSFADRWLQQMNYRMIRSFSLCWVPDEEGKGSLAGNLSHPEKMPVIPLRYIGWLSRFGFPGGEATAVGEDADEGGATVVKRSREGSPMEPFDLLVLLSGPEPQRSLLERKILMEALNWQGRMVLVRGLPAGGVPLNVPKGMLVYNHLPAKDLEGLIRLAGLVLARSGYSTVMDLARLGKKAVFIPTPGQTEQEYLGTYLAQQGWALCINQEHFSLPAVMTAARVFSFRTASGKEGDLLKEAIEAVLKQLRERSAGLKGL